jgi:hypothetical protein
LPQSYYFLTNGLPIPYKKKRKKKRKHTIKHIMEKTSTTLKTLKTPGNISYEKKEKRTDILTK